MSFSEMLDVLKVSSPFLTYHLENLGELVCKTTDGKYRLSTFGDTAMLTMSRVEELPKPVSSRSNRKTKSKLRTASTILHGISIILLVGLAIGLILASQHFINFTTSSTYMSIHGPDSVMVHPDQNYTFYIAIDRRPLASYLFPNESNLLLNEYEFSNNHTYWFEDPVGNTPSWWRAVNIGLSVNASENIKVYQAFLWNESGGTVTDPQYRYGELDQGIGVTLYLNEVTEPCLYGFAVADLNTLNDANVTLKFQADWNYYEKPYFYYGQAALMAGAIGLVAALLWPILEVSDFLWSSMRRSRENKTQFQNLSSAQKTFKSEILDKQLVAKLAKKYTHPEQALRYWLEHKMNQGKTKEQALKEIDEENT